MPDSPPYHAARKLFREAITRTARDQGLDVHLVEKDYFCSLVLAELRLAAPAAESSLVFKGGTCLSKVYLDFYRLSEDLDFVIPTEIETPRSQRSRTGRPLKQLVEVLPDDVPGLRVRSTLTGHNNSTQYVAELEYDSVLNGPAGTIKLEIGLREPLLLAPETANVRTLLLDPFTGRVVIPDFPMPVMALSECCAEKLRAALTRREPAIRDFFDLDHISRQKRVDLFAPGLLDMVVAKLRVPGNPVPDLSPERVAVLRAQVDTQLRSVLRAQEFAAFDLDRSVGLVRDVHRALEPRLG